MPDLLVRSFAPLLQVFQPCFTQPSFRSFWGLVCAWILCSGRRSLTRIIQSAQLSKLKHYCSFHRFFSQARWDLDALGHCVFDLLLPFCSPALLGAVDDTLARKSGRHIWGADMHHDPLRSTRSRPFFSFGHNWVVFSLHVCFPFETTVCLYGKEVKVWYKTVDALWYSSAGQKLLRIIVVHDPSHRRRDDCFFSTDRALTPPEILTNFSLRWPLEVCFRDVKQFLGFEDPQNRVSRATQRTAPLIFYIYDLAVIWYAKSGHRSARRSTLQRLWYNKKTPHRSRIFSELYDLRLGRKGFLKTPLWMRLREKSCNPL